LHCESCGCSGHCRVQLKLRLWESSFCDLEPPSQRIIAQRAGRDQRQSLLRKLGVVLEEVDESVLWIEMLIDAGIIKKSRLNQLLNEVRQLTAIFTASRQRAKQK